MILYTPSWDAITVIWNARGYSTKKLTPLNNVYLGKLVVAPVVKKSLFLHGR
jgi:hypothetical protein